MRRPFVLTALLTGALVLSAGSAAAQSYTEVPLPDTKHLDVNGMTTVSGFSPKGTYFWQLAYSEGFFGERNQDPQARFFTWTTRDRKPVLDVSLKRSGWAIAAWSPDEKTVALPANRKGNPSYEFAILDAASGKQVGTVTPPANLSSPLSPEFTPDGKRLVVHHRSIFPNNDNVLAVYDVKADQVATLIDLGVKGYQQAGFAVSPDGKVLACAIGELQLWDLATGKALGVSKRCEKAFRVKFFPGGRELVTAHLDGALRVWDTTTPAAPKAAGVIGSFGSREHPWHGRLHVLDGGKRLAYVSTRGVEYIDRGGKQAGQLRSGHFGHSGDVSPDGALAVTGGAPVRVWSAADALKVEVVWQVVGPLPESHNGYAYTAALSADGGRLVAAGRESAAAIDTATGKVLGTYPIKEDKGGPAGVDHAQGRIYEYDWQRGTSAADVASGKTAGVLTVAQVAGILKRDVRGLRPFLVTGANGTRHVLTEGEAWALLDDKFQVLASGTRHRGPILDTDLKRLIVETRDGSLLVYETERGAQLDSLKLPQADGYLFRVFGLTRDGKSVYGHKGGGVWRLNLDNGDPKTPEYPFGAHDSQARGDVGVSALARKSPRLAFGGEREPVVRVWDGETGRLVANLLVGEGAVKRLVFSPDGNTLYGVVELSKGMGRGKNVLVKWDVTKADAPPGAGSGK